MSDLFDVDALADEANDVPFRFKLGGEEYELPPGSVLDWQHAQALENGQFDRAFRGMLGDDKYAAFVKNKLPVRRLGKLVNGYLKHMGHTPGESGASSSS